MIVTKCSCGFTIETETTEDAYKIGHQHFLDNINTHTISTIVSGPHMHQQVKSKWWKRSFGKHKGKDNV